MQKQPFPLRLEYRPVQWSAEFPLTHYRWEQPDREITKLHAHNGLEVGYCFEGSGVFLVEGKVFAFRAGDLAFISDREMHFARSTPGTTSRWGYLCFDPTALVGPVADDARLLSTAELCGPDWRNILAGRDHPHLEQLVLGMLGELDDRPAGYRSAVRGMGWTLLTLLHRLPGRSVGLAGGRDWLQRVAPALEYIAGHYAEDVDIPRLARLCRLSPTHFRRLFRQATGESPKHYLSTVRLRMAASLLRGTTRSVLEIALSVGYPTLSNFTRQFRQTFGQSPRTYRTQPEKQGD